MDRLDPIRVNGPWLRHHVFTGPSRLHMFASKEAIRQHLQPSGPKNQDQRVPPVARKVDQPPINTMQDIQTRGHPCLQAARRILVSTQAAYTIWKPSGQHQIFASIHRFPVLEIQLTLLTLLLL